MKRMIKTLLAGNKYEFKKILAGKARGLWMKIDPNHKSQRIFGLDEAEIQGQFVKFAKASDAFVDIGSSDGYYSLIYRKYNPGGDIYSCDANEEFLEEQLSNFQKNNFQTENRFHYTNKFLSEKNNDLNTTVDLLLAANSAERIFIKIDVDGAEMEVLKGAKATLSTRDCVLIIETHSKQLEIDCIKYLQNFNYKTKIIDNASWRMIIPEKRMIEHNRWFAAWK